MPLPLLWLIKAGVVYGGLLGTAAVMTFAERKVSAWIQFRHGPNRVGPWGLLQPVADAIKFLFKEEVMPAGANKLMFRLAPLLAAVPAMLTIAVIPFAGKVTEVDEEPVYLSITDLDIGVLYVIAIAGLGIYGVILGGWASNSKYSLLGGLRASAQMISYELSLILAVLTIVTLSGTLDLRQIAAGQEGLLDWNVFHPSGLIAFGLACVTLGRLLRRAKVGPRLIALGLSATGVVYLVGSFAAVFAPSVSAALDPFYGIAIVVEPAVAIWLIVVGSRRATPPAGALAHA